MTSKVASLFAFIFLLLPFFSLSDSKGNEPKSFDFLQHLQGYHKGQHVKGLHKVKQYLTKFGYLNNQNSNNPTHEEEDNHFDDLLESAIKTYQLNYNLKVTGILDANTVKQMMMPRCGVPDIINGTTRMHSGKKNKYHHGSRLLKISPHYVLPPGSPKWPSSKTSFTYGFPPGPQINMLRSACAQAFKRWSSVTNFTFQESEDYLSSNFQIGFFASDHDDGFAFDGPGGVLAHAFYPTDGRVHFDEDDNYSSDLDPNAHHIATVALHEIGHALGLAHSSVKDAIMYPTIEAGIRKDLHEDDIEGIQTLYNL